MNEVQLFNYDFFESTKMEKLFTNNIIIIGQPRLHYSVCFPFPPK